MGNVKNSLSRVFPKILFALLGNARDQQSVSVPKFPKGFVGHLLQLTDVIARRRPIQAHRGTLW
jgi:hypothetical protein